MEITIRKIIEDLRKALSNQDVKYYYFGFTENLSKEQLLYGVVMVNPVAQGVVGITTGLVDQETLTIEIVLAKSMQKQVYKNAQTETGDEYLVRVMAGSDTLRTSKTNTIRDVIRKNQRCYGTMQPEINITYDDDRIDIEGVVTATMTITILNHKTNNLS